jgi:HEPN domain-containing protein
MSHKKNKEEALRWLSTGQDDLDTARILKQNQKHAHACFHAQQAVEKAIKGVWYFYDQDPWDHSIVKLINELKEFNADAFLLLNKFADDAKKLDRLYIPTRYPNGLPDITPDLAYSEDDSDSSINTVEKILKEAELIIKGTQEKNEQKEDNKEAENESEIEVETKDKDDDPVS